MEDFLERPKKTKAGTMLELFLLFMIVVGTVSFCTETMPSLSA
jgi:hypothetical protein